MLKLLAILVFLIPFHFACAKQQTAPSAAKDGGTQTGTEEKAASENGAAQQNAGGKPEIGESPVKGAKKAKVTIIEYSDFQCPFCSRVNPTLDKVLKKYKGKVNLTYKFLPLEIHENAHVAAQAAVAAQKQNKFWEMHDMMFKHQDHLERESLLKYAKKLHMNVKKFEKDMDDPKTAKRVDEEKSQANSLGFRGTPSFYIAGEQVIGAESEDKFEEAINKALK